MNDSLTVIQVTPFYPPTTAYGGIPKVAAGMAEDLCRRGHRVIVFTTDVFDRESRYTPGWEAGLPGRPEVRRFRNLSNRMAYDHQLYLPMNIRRDMDAAVREAHIVHLHGHRHFLNNIALSAAVEHGVHAVMSGHGTVPVIERKFLAKRIFDLFFGDRVLYAVSGFIAVSEAEKRQYLIEGLPEEKIEVIYNAVDKDRFEDLPPEGAFKGREGIGGEYILYLGKITPRKGLEHLVKAYDIMGRRNIKLVIAGNDMGHGRVVEDLVEKLDLRDHVVFTGLLDDEEVKSAYTDALVTVYPSTLEIFGLVPFESMLCGTPVIVSDDCGCGEVVEKSGGGYTVPYGDPPALAEKITEVLENPEEARSRVRRGRKFVMKELNRDKVGAELVRFYRRIIDNAAG